LKQENLKNRDSVKSIRSNSDEKFVSSKRIQEPNLTHSAEKGKETSPLAEFGPSVNTNGQSFDINDNDKVGFVT